MSLPRSEIVHVWLEVLDDSAMVCAREVRARVRERKSAHGGIVRLQDRFKVKRQTVP